MTRPDERGPELWSLPMVDALAWTLSAVGALAGAVTLAVSGWVGVVVLTLLFGVQAVRHYRRAFPKVRQ